MQSKISMTKQKFKQAMKRGLGRCVLELESADDPDQYYNAVLWGCTHNFAYDAQCEGTRAGYVYELIKRFPNKEPFLKEIICQFEKNCFTDGWDFSHCCDLLALFASDGSQEAVTALRNQYDCYYNSLMCHSGKRSIDPERDGFEELSICLIRCSSNPFAAYLKIAADIGRIFLHNPFYDGRDFEWLYEWFGLNYGKSRAAKVLTAAAKQSCDVEKYIGEIKLWKTESDIRRKKRLAEEPNTQEEFYYALMEGKKPGSWVGRRIAKAGKPEMILEFAAKYCAEKDDEKRLLLLKIFTVKSCPFPLSPEAVIADAQSENEELSDTAFLALAHIRHESVRQFALDLLQKGINTEDAAILLAKNYRKEDKEIFLQLIYHIQVDYKDTMNWHRIFTAVYEMFQRGGTKDAPRELLPYLYETTLCSFCRETVLMEMGRRRMISKQLLRECVYDCNEDIRNYAKRKIRHQQTGNCNL